MPCAPDESCYSICATFFQADFQAGESFACGRDSLAAHSHRIKRFAGDGVESGEAFSETSPGVGTGAVELFGGFPDIVEVVGQDL